jgi:hypothetical protein
MCATSLCKSVPNPYSIIWLGLISLPVSSGDSINSSNSSRMIQCDCGNTIEYEDIGESGDFPAYSVLSCNRCSKKHRIIVDGTLGNLIGAALSH